MSVRLFSRPAAIALALVALAFGGHPIAAQPAASPFTTGYRYDAAGQLVGVIRPDDGVGAIAYQAQRTTYGTKGLPTRVEHGSLAAWQGENVPPSAWTGFSVTHIVEFSYDALGRKIQERSVEGTTAKTLTETEYDAFDRPICTAVRMNEANFASAPVPGCTHRPAGPLGPDRIARTSYDNRDRPTQIEKAVGTAIAQVYAAYTYNEGDKPLSVTDANGNKAAMGYDGFERQTRWTFPSKTVPGSVDATDYEEYGYDANANRMSLRKRDGSMLTYQYDALNRMTMKIVPERAGLAAAHTRDVYYEYDLRGLPTKTRFDSIAGEGITNAYDGFGRLISSSSNMGGTARSVGNLYDMNGNRIRIIHPDTSFFNYEHDGLDRATVIRENGGDPIAAFTYDSAGRRVSSGWAAVTSYAYDPVGRLQALSHDLAGTSRDHVLGFTYNPASQILTRSASNDAYAWSGAANVARPYAVNGLNQYVSAGPATFGYDANGNLASTANAPWSTSYVYDVENRLVSASGTDNAELVYDPLGRLFQVSSGGGNVRRLVYDGDALVAEYDTAGNMPHRYIHGNDAGDDPLVWYDNFASGWRRALLTDHQGSVIQVADMYGNPVATNSYDPWGLPGATPAGRFGYTGQTWLPELGLWYYKARFYSPTLGRFLQVDPIGYDDQINLYAYVGNDPVNLTDPTGTTISAVYFADAGVVRARDNDTGEERWASAFSGGTSGDFQGGPVPAGDYAILEGAGDNSYRLERYDSHFGDDRTPENRTDLRFHPKGTQSIGCITCHPGKGGLSIGALLRGTKTGTTTVDYRGRNPFRSREDVKRYGSMRVMSTSNVRFDKNTMRVSVYHPGDKTHKPRTQYVCTIKSTGQCIR